MYENRPTFFSDASKITILVTVQKCKLPALVRLKMRCVSSGSHNSCALLYYEQGLTTSDGQNISLLIVGRIISGRLKTIHFCCYYQFITESRRYSTGSDTVYCSICSPQIYVSQRRRTRGGNFVIGFININKQCQLPRATEPAQASNILQKNEIFISEHVKSQYF